MNWLCIFFTKRGISSEIDTNEYILEAAKTIELTHDIVTNLVRNNIDRLQYEPVWSILHDMYLKCHEFTSGSLTSFLVAHISSAEALCRTAIESAVNLQYASYGDDVGNVIAYFRLYLATERDQNKSWLKSVEKSNGPNEEKEYHRDCIRKKYENLDVCENALRESFSIMGIDFDSRRGSWPSIFDRFCKINKEIDYRTIYAALCSQAHNDPEDILNNLMSRIIQIDGIEENGYAQAVEIEQYFFSLNMVLTAISFYVEATAMYLAKYNIPVSKNIIPILIKTKDLIIDLQTNSKSRIANPVRLAIQASLTKE
ncbi:DUF5677 domain-containing protein [Paraburkholderia sp. BL9I2N2]|uniref:DUF5677 domain-containing protein n=1 Tax=Paraburkholderia sp. BL9I2N2 TaxID=1938809 RepID=UPI00104689D1|nr:DUF5677 domain-containing protein [Paraburkholderia sp. BL9I2N2]TCK90845.1 hypothetical protein B0G74_4656 [Paraburkholderia sp. BL9I2N2]